MGSVGRWMDRGWGWVMSEWGESVRDRWVDGWGKEAAGGMHEEYEGDSCDGIYPRLPHWRIR